MYSPSPNQCNQCHQCQSITMAISPSLVEELLAQTRADPELPRANPTTSFWQMPPHPSMSAVQSAELPAAVDVAIIGSGVTGCSVAKHLLEHPGFRSGSGSGSGSGSSSGPAGTVAVLEARNLTSGATGRNGGLLTNHVPGDYRLLSDRFGHAEATKIARFANRTLEKMHALGNSSDEFRAASVVRRLLDVICFDDEPAFTAAKASFELYEQHVPEDRGKTKYLTAEEAASTYQVVAKAGAIVFPNGAFWPYRLITRVWAQLHEQHRGRLSIDTNTPVTAVTHDPASSATHPYVLATPRGAVRAAKVVHATNGYTGHLLPALRGKIFPLRGTMSTQVAPAAFGRRGHEVSWSMVSSGVFDSATDVLEVGLYYSNQNPDTGDIFIGGEKVKLDELLVSDDTEVRAPCRDNIVSVLPRYHTRGWADGQAPEARKVWSGIMGFTADRLPLVGRLPQGATRREGDEEWIAAGFNGFGMPLCWSSGEAVARMMLGEGKGEDGEGGVDFLPEAFLATKERLDDEARMATRTALELLLSGHP
ncbi:FAD dependent oxidoreductase [Purpureocillium lavendulum]|uniref:FAD dependent oxidoreductase n=1 Tax=Purpureocillium lavendulum TaxID=1247861 RepID=A0AB34FFB2_9HYPO|nr:FAD dependent oxidoreductase [Purpureocillium lavendulum]